MKILQIRLKNLNSLVGSWTIDFTHPAYEAGGIFAIIGPTGAGKTTILDALCLALYGRTPRLSKITKGVNDIMSRQTGECYAEVSFATQSGRFCCNWSQRRAHRKADGELQAPKHEISNLATGAVVETRLRGVADQIEQITGMDFDRFTRSMLLAQGGFAAFLQAAADERAPILEQITGTGVYSQISMKVHERRSEERKCLEILQAELAGMPLLAEEEVLRLHAELARLNLSEAGIHEAVGRLSRALAWLENINGLTKELARLAELQEDLVQRRQLFEPQRRQLEQAQKALELAGEYATLDSLRQAQEAERISRLTCLSLQPVLQAGIVTREEALLAADATLARCRAGQKEVLALSRQARGLDLQLAEKLLPIRAASETIALQEKNLENLRAQILAEQRIFEEHQDALLAVQRFLDGNRHDEGLVEQLAALCARFDVLRALEAKTMARAGQLVLARAQKEESQRLWLEVAARQEGLQKGYVLAQEVSATRQGEQEKLLAGHDLAAWLDELSALKERQTMLLQLGVTGQDLQEASLLLHELSAKKEQFTVERTSLLQRIEGQGAKLAGLERELNLLETQLSLLKRIDDLKEARRQLRDNEPCPLCGASEHPYAAGNIPAPDETRLAVLKVRTDLREAADSLSALKVREAEICKDLEHVELRRSNCAETIARGEMAMRLGLDKLVVPSAQRPSETLLPVLLQENENTLAEVQGRVQAIADCEKELVAVRASLEHNREALVKVEREGQTALRSREAAEIAFTRAETELQAHAAELAALAREIQQEVEPYGVKSLSAEALDQVQRELVARRDSWQIEVTRKNALEKHIAALAVNIQHGTGQITAGEAEILSRREMLAALVAERDVLANRRRELFADKNPDAEDNRLQTMVDAAEKQRLEADKLRRVAILEMDKLQSRLTNFDQTMTGRAAELQTLTATFGLRLQLSGFADEEQFRNACLTEDARLELLQARDRLDRETAEVEARWRDRSQQLAAERSRQLTDQPQSQLERERDEYLLAMKALQQEIGSLHGRLKDNELLREKQQARVEAIQRQNRECRRWDMLHGLIGSADGKKYRNFAQGLTFEIMIGYANRQLRKMSDRYLLLRDEGQPLDLNVIDSYQAGEIRSTRNLSGGESFLVSLALALGLSQMASRNVRVDSLFLDEGFGTLDEEALDTALQTLAGLQQDGKLIGVISHVPALRERISTRIQVSSRTGGRSVIEGPGCQRSEEK